MTQHLHRLEGCGTRPLAHYLKALGVLRLISEQVDKNTRGFWRKDSFGLVTSLDRAELIAFFADEYAPSPLVAPWNGGSGFYPGDKAARQKGIQPILRSTSPRFEPYRTLLASCLEMTSGLIKRPDGDDKAKLQAKCRADWPTGALKWLTAALVLGDTTSSYPALLGTGGNDGRLDFTSNYMQRLVEVIDMDSGTTRSRAPLIAALFGGAAEAAGDVAIGQFMPGSLGGANGGNGFDGRATVNSWDFILMLEGALVLQVAAVRHLDSAGLAQAAAPFAFRSAAAGYASATRSEESARGEQWMPLWESPATLQEVQSIFRDGRVQMGRERVQTVQAAAQAIATRSVTSGISAFERFGFLERNGQANLAVPLGRWTVHSDPGAQNLADIQRWIDSLRRASKDPVRDPQSLRAQVQRVEGHMLEICREPAGTDHWRALLMELAAVEDDLARRKRHTKERYLRPMPRLSQSWLDLAAGQHPDAEIRLAAAIATYRVFDGKASHGMRKHCLPLAKKKLGDKVVVDQRRFHEGKDSLLDDPGVVWRGRDLLSDLVAVETRRIVEASKAGAFVRRPGLHCSAHDLQQLILGHVDERRVGLLARSLMTLHIDDWPRARTALGDGPRATLPPAFALLAFMVEDTGALGDRKKQTTRVIMRLLSAGRADEAVQRAAHVLRLRGHRTRLHRAIYTPKQARRYAAALCIPMRHSDLQRMQRIACMPDKAIPSTQQGDTP